MNAIRERLVGTLGREALDRTLIVGEAYLHAVPMHYNTARLSLSSASWDLACLGNCRHDRFSRVADPAVLHWTHAVETTTNRRPVGGGHTAAGHGLVTGVLAVRFHRSARHGARPFGTRRGVPGDRGSRSP
jgi:hypothetical protein